MRNIKLTMSYDGTSYYGFQSQPDGNTVQDKIEQAIGVLTGETIKLIGSGRTDAGVHARKQVVNFFTSSAVPIERWCLALNARLPSDIVMLEAKEVPLSFHSRRDAIRKTYCYKIRYGRHKDVFNRNFEYHHYGRLNLEAMSQALQHLVGTHDFTSFCSVRSVKSSHIRTIYEAGLEYRPDSLLDSMNGVIQINLTGNGFLYNMVRIVVGTLLQIGEGKKTAAQMKSILEACDRSQSGPTAMAHGLTLWEVEYT